MKYYSDGGENVFDKLWWMEDAREARSPVVVELMKADIGGEMWCRECSGFVESLDDCGKRNCDKYNPCNGKNGRCRHLTWGSIGTGKMYRITAGGKVRRVNER